MKVFLTYITLLCVFFILLSCGDPIADNSRIALNVTVEDDSADAIEDIEVNVEIYRRGTFGISLPGPSSFSGIIGTGITDENGEARFISFKPGNVDEISVITNGDGSAENVGFDTRYNTVITILDSLPSNDITLPTITLREPTQLDIRIENTSATLDTLSFQVNYKRTTQYIDPQGELEQLNRSEISRSLTIENPLFQISTQSLQGSTLLFTYELINGTVLESNSIEVPLDQENTAYIFEY